MPVCLECLYTFLLLHHVDSEALPLPGGLHGLLPPAMPRFPTLKIPFLIQQTNPQDVGVKLDIARPKFVPYPPGLCPEEFVVPFPTPSRSLPTPDGGQSHPNATIPNQIVAIDSHDPPSWTET
eukprot:scaffold2353_cov167-Amphora_coffeaeformis.AAC.3